MPIQRLNHAVLFVSDVERSAEFYVEVLGFRRIGGFPGGAFLRAQGSANDHDLGLFQSPHPGEPHQTGQIGLYHLAWEVDTLGELLQVQGRLQDAEALRAASNHGSTKALYAADPDGIELEVCWLVPDWAVEREITEMTAPTRPLDLSAEIAIYGADVQGGPRTDHAVWQRLAAGKMGR